MFYEVTPVGKVEALTYNYNTSLSIGQIVLVPLGKKVVPGIVIKKVAQPNFETKSISKILYSQPLPAHLIKTMGFIHDYYLAPLGSAASLILPVGIEKKRRTKPNKAEQSFGRLGVPPRSDIPLNPAQKMALKGLQKAPGATKLLYGVTGSGKTNIYLKMALNAFEGQKSTVLLVPEIALTSQLVQVFREVFGERVKLIHSKLTEAERHLIFDDILNSTEPLVVIGPRSALFAPLFNLGLVIIDEEHEMTYYQENPPRYSAIRVASFMVGACAGQCILGSATPSVVDYYVAKQKNSLIALKKKAKTNAKKAAIHIIDSKNRDNFTRNRYFSNSLLSAIEKNLTNGQQTLIFHNRRGSAPLTICEHCGNELVCPNCFLPLTLHADVYELACHTCGYHEKMPPSCPKCDSASLLHKGFGTKLLENELKKLFRGAQIRRFDADSKKNESLDALYEDVRGGKIDILIGTQGLAKGLDLPKLATVGVVQADAGLVLPDFAAEERVFQLLTQVIGRVGRGHLDTAQVFIQTFKPEHPVINYAVQEDYENFVEYLLKKRRKSGFPPYKYIAKLEMTMKTEATVLRKIQEAIKTLNCCADFLISPPQPAFHEYTAKGYTWEIIVRAKSRKDLADLRSKIDKNFKFYLDLPGLL